MTTMKELRELAKHKEPAIIATEICRRFPALKNAPGVSPWKPLILDAWAASDAASTGHRAVVRFVLAVWNGSEDTWQVGPFRPDDLRDFDPASLEVFRAWAENPFWL